MVFLFNFRAVAGEKWKAFHGRIVTIRYQDEDQMWRLSKKIRFAIQVYPNQKELGRYYSNQYEIGESPLAVYDADEDTVYISLKDLYERILAHEMAHMVIDQAFHVVLPIQVQEILAQYVDMHIND